MVEHCAAVGLWDNSTSVQLEDGLIGFNGNGDWLLSHSSSQGWWRLWSHINEASVLHSNGECLASSIVSSIWIGILCSDTVVSGIFKGHVHKSTTATIVSVWLGAVNELLLRQGNKFPCGNVVHTFKGTSWREGPAWSTAALVLHWGHTALFQPIDWFGHIGQDTVRGSLGCSVLLVPEEHLVLVIVKISNVGNTESVGLSILWVVGWDFFKILRENI